MSRICIKFIVFLVLFTSCKNTKEDVVFVSFGKKISAENTISNEEMGRKFDNLKVGDTLNVKFSSEISKVCQKKGCWIKVPLDGSKESFVKFKDYAFFMPMNSAGNKVILNGKAFKNQISVNELKHYARDAGKSEQEIAKITKPKITYSFLADGVLLSNGNNEN